MKLSPSRKLPARIAVSLDQAQEPGRGATSIMSLVTERWPFQKTLIRALVNLKEQGYRSSSFGEINNRGHPPSPPCPPD